jgi:hypothetical protein
MRTYQHDLEDAEMHLAAIKGSLHRGIVITPGEAGCLKEAERALRDCYLSMRGEEVNT